MICWRRSLRSLVRIETVHQLTPELAESISEAGLVLFVDAAAPTAERPAGTLHCEEVHAESSSQEALGHHLTPSQVLAYATALHGVKPKAYLASVAAESFDYGAPLSPCVKAALPALIRWIRNRIEEAG
jgi:hydrogenase maturation protease